MSTFCTGGRHKLYFILEDVQCCPKICNLCFCRVQSLVARALPSLVNTSVRSVIGATSKEPVCPRVELILKIIIILLIIFLGFIKSKPC